MTRDPGTPARCVAFVAAAVAAGALAVPTVGSAAGNGACDYLTPALVSSLFKGGAHLDSPTVSSCAYSPQSEQHAFDDDEKSVATFQLLPVVLRKGKARYQATVKTLQKKAPPGTTGFKRGTLAVERGEATYTYFRAGGIGSGIAVIRSEDVIGLLVVDVKRKARFTAGDLQKAVSTILADMESLS